MLIHRKIPTLYETCAHITLFKTPRNVPNLSKMDSVCSFTCNLSKIPFKHYSPIYTFISQVFSFLQGFLIKQL